MSDDHLSLLSPSVLNETFPGRWWVPTAAGLERLDGETCVVRALCAPTGADPFSAAEIWVGVEHRSGNRLIGSIAESAVELPGYQIGDQIELELDQIFDYVTVGSDGSLRMNIERARIAIGRRVLVGLTAISPDGQILERRQLAAELIAVREDGLALMADEGGSFGLPPDIRGLREAAPGEYRLRESGEVIANPDYTYTSTINLAEGHSLPVEGFVPPAGG